MTRSLAGWWTFDGREITAVTSTDKSGNSNNATRTNGPLAGIGKIGQGLGFDGVNDYLNIAHSTSLNITSTISLSAWVKPLTGFGSSSTLITKGNIGTGYILSLNEGKPKMALTGAGNVWTDLSSYPSGSLDSINISGDGQKIFGVDSAGAIGNIYLSTDNGSTWSSLKSNGYWRTVASSYNGQIIAAGQCCGSQINVSTNGGSSWSTVGPSNVMVDIDMSTSGIKQVAISTGGVFVSTDSGSNWLQKTTGIPVVPEAVAMSDNGNIITAVDTGGKIYVSTDTGNNWTAKDSNRNWSDVAVSGDGTLQTAVVSGGQIYISTTTGNTWVAKDSNRTWSAIDMSSDGVNQTAVVYDGQIYISTTTGNTWVAKGSSRSWLNVSMSNDGDKRVVCDNTFANHSPYFSSALAVTGLSSLISNNWYHIASTYDGTNFKMFVNGSLVATSTGSATIDSNTNPLRIGGYSSNYFKGSLDDVRVYNRALSVKEVTQLFSLGKAKMVTANRSTIINAKLIMGVDAISGTPKEGFVLTVGTITPVGATVSYQWKIATSPDGAYTNISGANSSTYTPIPGDVGKYIKVIVTGTGSYIGSITSAATAVITSLAVGDSFQGGKVAYILQSGDPGYIAGQTHGLIAATSNQSTGAAWGCYGTNISGAVGTVLGTGNQNTISIMAGCATAGIAARICGDLSLNGYNDWYLPSTVELTKLYLNRALIGGFTVNYYWSSTQRDAWAGYVVGFDDGVTRGSDKTWGLYVRAIRSF
ncbi:MAG: LamG-like jellyroll fold domain-containing protein [Candidatus Magasanikiibacteriota bacterium]